MNNEIIIPGKLEATSLGPAAGIGQVLENGVVLLNTDYKPYEGAFDEAKNAFAKAFNMSNNKIVWLMFKKPKNKAEILMSLAARMAYYQREAAALNKLKNANNKIEAYFGNNAQADL
jgi:hypothetical protein